MPPAAPAKSEGGPKPLKGNAKIPYKFTVNLPNEGVMMVEALERRSWWKKAKESDTFNFWWGPNGERFDWKKLTHGTRQLVNRLEDHKEICTKNNIARNLISYARKARKDVSKDCGIPTTIILSNGGTEGVKQLKSNMNEFNKAANVPVGEENKENKHLSGDMWIVKPAGRNRGIGIEVFKGFKEVEKFINKQTGTSNWVVQKYLEDPMLIHGCKFDIRQLILVSHEREVFMYESSYIRTSSSEYTKDNMDRAIHLVNDYVQKHEENYGKFEDANKLSFDDFRAICKEHGKDFDEDVWPQILEITRNVFRAVGDKLNPRRTDYCFELMGMDFMLDSSFKVWLIEVNTSPALFRHGKVLEDLMPPMIEEVVQKTVDKVFPPPEGTTLPGPTLNTFVKLDL